VEAKGEGLVAVNVVAVNVEAGALMCGGEGEMGMVGRAFVAETLRAGHGVVVRELLSDKKIARTMRAGRAVLRLPRRRRDWWWSAMGYGLGRHVSDPGLKAEGRRARRSRPTFGAA